MIWWGIGEHCGSLQECSALSPLVLGTTTGDIFDTTAIRNEPLLSNHVFKFICIKLGEAPLL